MTRFARQLVEDEVEGDDDDLISDPKKWISDSTDIERILTRLGFEDKGRGSASRIIGGIKTPYPPEQNNRVWIKTVPLKKWTALNPDKGDRAASHARVRVAYHFGTHNIENYPHEAGRMSVRVRFGSPKTDDGFSYFGPYTVKRYFYGDAAQKETDEGYVYTYDSLGIITEATATIEAVLRIVSEREYPSIVKLRARLYRLGFKHPSKI